MVPRQLSLAVLLRDDARFANFHSPAGSPRAQVTALLHAQWSQTGDARIYLWGRDVGLSHLLQAACHHVLESGGKALYLPLAELVAHPPDDVLAEFERAELVALDQVAAVAGDPAWELALFDLCNRIEDRRGRLLLAATCAPRELALQLADLRSRLSASNVFHLPPYADADRAAILQFRAARLGLAVGAEAAHFILHRAPRDMAALMNCLRVLDQATLDRQCKPTIPVIKQVFGW